MGERCFWCDVDPDAAADRHEGPHLKWCLRYREPPLPTGVQLVKVGGVTMIVMIDPLMPADEIRMSCGPRPEQNVGVTGLAHNTGEPPAAPNR
jgi:hypothetical protein